MRKDRQAKRRGKERNERSLRVHREGPNVSFSPGRDGPVVYRMPTLTGVPQTRRMRTHAACSIALRASSARYLWMTYGPCRSPGQPSVTDKKHPDQSELYTSQTGHTFPIPNQKQSQTFNLCVNPVLLFRSNSRTKDYGRFRT